MLPRLSAEPACEVAVAYLRSDAPELVGARDRLLTLLDDEERERYVRFRFDDDRQTFLVAHALTRALLAVHLQEPPAALRFERGEHGRPELLPARNPTQLRFNLSHTRGLVACAVARNCDVGVDVERVDREVELLSVAGRVYSDEELRHLRALVTDEEQRQRFFELWTLKESYIKAIGKGFSAPLQAITFHAQLPDPVRVSFDPAFDDAQRWRFRRFVIAPRHRLAVAWTSRSNENESRAVTCREVVLADLFNPIG